MTNGQSAELATRLGARFEVCALHVGDRIEIRGLEPRLGSSLPAMIEVAPAGYAVLLRAGAVVLFGVDAIQQERLLADLGARITGRHERPEVERATVRIADVDGIEPDALLLRELTVERLQAVAEVLGKSVTLARHELEIAEAFNAIEPLALQMKTSPRKLPWKRAELVRQIGVAMLAEHQLVGRAEIRDKPDLLWDRPELDRLYTRLADEYELRDRVLALERKLEVVSRAAQTMLELHQAKRALHVEYYIVALIVFEIVLALVELLH